MFSPPQNIENLKRYLRRSAFILAPNGYGATPILRARFNDAVFVSCARGYLFASNEKVANSTMRATFQRLEAGGTLPPHYKPLKRWTGPLAQPSDLKNFGAILEDPSVKKFCVVRHPYARLVSCYRNKFEEGSRGRGFPKMMRQLGLDPKRDDISFEKFVRAIAGQNQQDMNPHWRVQYYNVFMDMISYDEVIRYEAVGEALGRLASELYPEATDSRDLVVSENRHAENSDELVARYFTPELKKVALEAYQRDFGAFGYEA